MNVMIMDRKTLQCYLEGNFPLHDTAVISFFNEGEKEVDFTVNPDVSFVKAEISSKSDSKDPRAWEYISLSEAYRMIVGWNALKTIKTIICEDENGKDLSAGCAAAIEEYYNHDGIRYFTDGLYKPDIRVYNGIYNRLIHKW